MARPRSGRLHRPGRPRTIATSRAKTRTRISAMTINLMLVWKPSQTWGTARRRPSGLKNTCRNLPISPPPCGGEMGKFLHAFFSPLGLRRAVPQVWDGFQTNIKLMVIAEILVLVFALAVAIVRGLPGRATLPLRMLAIAYTDF